jgi:NADH-quinone oxidoreductase subunit E
MENKKIWENYSPDQRHTLAILQDIQKAYRYLPEEVLQEVAEYLDIPMSKVYSMATFYKALSLKPKGKYVVKVCDGTACHIRGSGEVMEALQSELQIKIGETTQDNLFSIEVVNCLGACALAPVIMVNDTYYGKMNRTKVIEVIAEYRGAENE